MSRQNPRMLERTVKDKIKVVLKGAGAWYFMPAMNGYGRPGIPDFIVCHRGRFIAIEAKGTGGRLSEPQIAEITAIGNAAGLALVIGPEDLGKLAQLLT